RAETTEHRIGEPALLPHVLKQPRAHRTAEQRVQHVARIPIVVVLRIAAGADADVALLELFAADENLRHDVRRLLADRFTGLDQRSELPVDELSHMSVLEIPDGRDNEVPRCVRLPKIAAQQIRTEGLHGFARAQYRTAQRVIFPEALGENLMD